MYLKPNMNLIVRKIDAYYYVESQNASVGPFRFEEQAQKCLDILKESTERCSFEVHPSGNNLILECNCGWTILLHDLDLEKINNIAKAHLKERAR